LTKAAASKKIDFGRNVLPPATLCQRRTSHQRYAWAKWSAVVQGWRSSTELQCQLKEYCFTSAFPSIRPRCPNSEKHPDLRTK